MVLMDRPTVLLLLADIQIATENCYLELGEVEAGSDRWRKRWK